MKCKDKNNCCCDMRGLLSFLILYIVSKKPMHGQKIAKELAERKGSLPSPGTIYPALKSLYEAGLIKETMQGKMIIYSLTNKGQKELKVTKQKFFKMFKGLV
jgi:DNA-binding PadR family transcriptional regulator